MATQRPKVMWMFIGLVLFAGLVWVGRRALMRTHQRGPLYAPWPKMDFVHIPAGTFKMGSNQGDLDERPVRTVIITHPFDISRREITQGQYYAVMGKDPSAFKGGNRPVEHVSWNDATEFCRRLTLHAHQEGRLSADLVFRLPTEAEWEYVCRAGSTGVYSFGDSSAELGTYAWYRDNSATGTREAGTARANAWGVHDMHGNVREWCLDSYEAYHPYELTDPVSHKNNPFRVSRGGGFRHFAWGCRSADRRGDTLSTRDKALGFRIVAAETIFQLERSP